VRRAKTYVTAFALSAFFVAGFVLSAAFVVVHAGHSHEGVEACEACAYINSEANQLKRVIVSMPVGITPASAAAFLDGVLLCACLLLGAFTPVALKNRMNN
jgi:hypothetical protein